VKYGGIRNPLYISKECMSVTLYLSLRAPYFYPDPTREENSEAIKNTKFEYRNAKQL